jgi:hypothetical protein
MARRKYILHEYADDRIKEGFRRIKSRNKQRDQSRTTFGKVSKTFLLLYDRYIVVLVADNSIMMERKRRKNKLYIHTYYEYIFNMIASTDRFGSRR